MPAVPLEIIAAAGFVPFRIKGNVNEPITKADTQMETIVCPLVRSCFDVSLKGSYHFLYGLTLSTLDKNCRVMVCLRCDGILLAYFWRGCCTHSIFSFHQTQDLASTSCEEFLKI
jgi:hypothetical protein